jgi:hypothetical protein
MEIQGTWTKDEDGFMSFSAAELQRLFEAITDKYHQVYNHYLEDIEDDEAYYKALADGYEMITDYKVINNVNEFATTYTTPAYVADLWYETDKKTGRRRYDRGFIRICSRQS